VEARHKIKKSLILKKIFVGL